MTDERPLPAARPPAPTVAFDADLERAERYAASALSPATRKAYAGDWLVFARWCAAHRRQALPAAPATVGAFLAAEADRGFRPVTIGRWAAAIAAAHRAQDQPNPCDSGAVEAVMAGIRREHGVRPLRQAKPLQTEPLWRLIEPIDITTPAGLRDRSLLLLGFAAAHRLATEPPVGRADHQASRPRRRRPHRPPLRPLAQGRLRHRRCGRRYRGTQDPKRHPAQEPARATQLHPRRHRLRRRRPSALRTLSRRLLRRRPSQTSRLRRSWTQ